MGFSLIYFIPKIERIFEWIDYHEEEMVQKPQEIPLPPVGLIEPETALEEKSEDVSEYLG